MRVFYNPSEFKAWANKSVVTVGNFDGVHLAHQHLLKLLNYQAQLKNLPSVVVFFEPQPQEYLHATPLPRLMSMEDKLKCFKEHAVNTAVCLDFNDEMSQLSPELFVKEILVEQLGMQQLIVGADFKFGKDRLGDISLLQHMAKQYLFVLTALEVDKIGDVKISSTAIRHWLSQGACQKAAQFLGRPYSIKGTVSKGEGRGKTLGFPTVNIRLGSFFPPVQGVFAVKVKDKHLTYKQGIANVGVRPTIQGKDRILETYVFDFDEIWYGEDIEVFFLKKIRNEMKFQSLELLKKQIAEDIIQVRQYFEQIDQIEKEKVAYD